MKVKRKRKPSEKITKIVRRFTTDEAYTLLKDLIVYHKFHTDLYILFGLWLSGLMNNRQFSYLRELSGGSINVTDIQSNTAEYQELIQDLVLEMISFKKDHEGNIKGLVAKVSWDRIPIFDKKTKQITHYLPLEGNKGMVVSFVRGAFINMLYRCLGKSYRGDVNYNNLYCAKRTHKGKDSEVSRLRTAMQDETDTAITTPELIFKLKGEGFSDVTMFQYRYIYSLGNYKTFTELTEEVIIRASVLKEVQDLSSSEKYKKAIFEQIFSILNSRILPKVNREFLKCYYNIPTMVDFWGDKKVFNNDMVTFFEQYPEYKKVLKVQRISYAGGRKIVSMSDNEKIVQESSIYKESHRMFKRILEPILAELSDSYGNSHHDAMRVLSQFSSLKTNAGSLDQYNNSDSYFNTFCLDDTADTIFDEV